MVKSKANNAPKTEKVPEFSPALVAGEFKAAFVAGFKSESLRTEADTLTGSMSEHLLAASRICRTAAVFEAQSGVHMDFLKTPAGAAFCAENGIKLKATRDGKGWQQPPTYKQYVSNILKAMRYHEDKALRDEHGKPLVPPIADFKTESSLRAALNSAQLKDKVEQARIADNPGITDQQREQQTAEYAVRKTLAERLESLKEHSQALTPDRQQIALEHITLALKEVDKLWNAQVAEEKAANEAAQKAQMQAETNANALPGAHVETGAGARTGTHA